MSAALCIFWMECCTLFMKCWTQRWTELSTRPAKVLTRSDNKRFVTNSSPAHLTFIVADHGQRGARLRWCRPRPAVHATAREVRLLQARQGLRLRRRGPAIINPSSTANFRRFPASKRRGAFQLRPNSTNIRNVEVACPECNSSKII